MELSLHRIKDTIETGAKVYEIHLTCVLVVVAIVLLAVACWGKPHHKALAILYIVL